MKLADLDPKNYDTDLDYYEALDKYILWQEYRDTEIDRYILEKKEEDLEKSREGN